MKVDMQRIDTQAALDALPAGSAIRDAYGSILVCDGPHKWLEPGASDLEGETKWAGCTT